MAATIDLDVKDPRWSVAAYARFLGLVRKVRSAKRNLLRGDIPEWVSDFSGLLGHANVISVLPTVLAVGLVPRHFFRRVREEGKRAIPLSISPAKFILQCCVLVALCLAPLGLKLNEKVLILYVAAVVFSSPLWIAIVVGVAAFVAKVLREGRPTANSDFLSLLLLRLVGAALPYEAAISCLQTLRMKRLSFRRFFWGSCYLSLTSLVEVALIGGVCCGIIYLSELVTQSGVVDAAKDWPLTVAGITSLLLLAASMRLVTRGYSALIDAVALYPSSNYYRVFRRKMAELCEEYYALGAQLRTRAQMLALMNSIIKDAVDAEEQNRYDERRRAAYLRSRERGLSDVGDVTIYFEDPEDLKTCELFITLKQPRLLTSDPRDAMALIKAQLGNDR